MSSATDTVRHPKGPSEAAFGSDAPAYLQSTFGSSVGSKVLVALTGAGLFTFVIFHMIGNWKLFQGPDAINSYAYFLKHSLGALIWIARGGLLAIFVLHLVLAIRLKLRAVAARPVPYAYPRSAQAGIASRSMIWTGAVIGLFTLFHLLHFTFLPQEHNVYEMVVAGFSNSVLAAIYLLAQVALFVHLRHGIPSVFQTLGLKNGRFRKPIDLLGLAIALTILIGNCAIVLAVQFGWVQSQMK